MRNGANSACSRAADGSTTPFTALSHTFSSSAAHSARIRPREGKAASRGCVRFEPLASRGRAHRL
eukprot:scaffold1077_cov253-Pinguiococcus_pyrenoidosus.AAC.7